MQFWCSAQGLAWTWTWRPYVGIWLFVVGVAVAYARAWRRATARNDVAARRRRTAAAGGILLLWIALDWPMGTLGAGYLVTVHTVQFLVLTLIVAPLLLLGLPRSTVSLRHPEGARCALTWLARHPLAAAIMFNVIMVGTHIPVVTDGLMTSQIGAAALDLLWIAGGLAFWAPICAPVAEEHRLVPPLQVLYLFLGSLPGSLVGAILTYASFPLYSVYELAPRVAMISAHDDQLIAGLIMWVGGFFLVLGVISVIFFRWASQEEAREVA